MTHPQRVTETRTRCTSCGSAQVLSVFVGDPTAERGGLVIRTCHGCGNRKGSYDVKTVPAWARTEARTQAADVFPDTP